MHGRWIKQLTTTTGGGNLTVSAVTGFPTFADIFPVNRAFYYTIIDEDGLPIEDGVGHLSASTTVVRDMILATYVSGTYAATSPGASAPSAVSLASGDKYVIQSVSQSTVPHMIPRQPTTLTANDNVLIPTNWYTPVTTTIVPDYPNYTYFWPVHFPFGGLVDGFGCRPNGTDTVDWGIYSMGANGLPVERICGDTGISLVSGVNNITLTNTGYIRGPGWYFIAMNVSGTRGWYFCNQTGGNMGIKQSRTFHDPCAAYRISQAQGTWPATLTGGSHDRWSTSPYHVPITYPRVAA